MNRFAFTSLTAILALAPRQASTPSGSFAQGKYEFIVVDGRSGAPIANAEVHWEEQIEVIPLDDSLWGKMVRLSEQHRRDHAEIERLATASGKFARSDENGRVELPIPAANALLAVRSNQLFGSSKDGVGYEFRLWPDGDLLVLAEDSNGKPLRDASVLLVEKSPEHPDGKIERRALTGPDGVARIAHGFVTIASASRMENRPQVRWCVAVDSIPRVDGLTVLDPDKLPREPIRVSLPPTGEVEIRLQELDKRPGSVEFAVSLREANLDSNLSEWNLGQGSLPKSGELRAVAVNGKVVFRNVCLGQKLVASALRNAPSQLQVLQITGPKRAGDRVRTPMVLGANGVTITARALDPDGQPIANAELRVERLNGPSPKRGMFTNTSPDEFMTRGRFRLHSDEQGRIWLDLPLDLADQGPPTLLVSQLREGLPTIESRLDLGERWTVGLHDLGDVRIEVAPIVLSGVVVDAEGAPVPGVLVVSGNSNVRTAIRTLTNACGEFELRSGAPYKAFDISVDPPPGERSKPSVSFKSGTTGLRLVR